MAVTTVTTTMAAGINYTVVTDSSIDWPSVLASTYFYDKVTKQVYYKDANGNITNLVDSYNQQIQNNGSNVTQRPIVNFTGAGVTTSDVGGKTVVNINGGGAGGTIRTAQVGITDVAGPGGIFTLGQTLIYAVQPTGGAAIYNNRWQFTIPADYSGGGVITLRVYRPGTAPTTSLTVYINGLVSNITGATFVPPTSANWAVFTFNLTTAAVAGDTLTILAALTAASGQDFYFRDVYFNYQS